MTIKEQIYETLASSGNALSVAEIIVLHPDWQRTYVSRALSELAEAGRVGARRNGRGMRYFVTDLAIDEDVELRGLHEDAVWDRIRQTTEFLGKLSERAENILYFSFTEMLNNAIDHSKSGTAHITMGRDKGMLNFTIRDYGIGVFNSIMTKKHLPDEMTAIQELVKGKITTMPRWHSGEGIFWTSKVADKFSLRSYGYKLTIDNVLGDYTIEKLDEGIIGTEVTFEVGVDTDKSLQKLFRDFTFDEGNLTLDITAIPVKLYEAGDVWISRSQAKRVLTGLEKYKKVIFDFKGISVVGQAFADQIFRVFRHEHPEIILEPINMGESVALMVNRALQDETGKY